MLTLIIIGRILLGGHFLIAGIRNFMRFAEKARQRTNYGFVLPIPMLAAGFAVQTIAGAMVVTGFYAAWGAAALIVFTASATALFHNVLMVEAKDRDFNLYLMLANIAFCGGFLLIIATALPV